MVTSEVNHIVTRATYDGCGECFISTENVDIITTTSTIDLKRLNPTERNKATCSGDHCFGDDKGVSDWCSYDDESVDTRSTIDRDRAILEIAVAVTTRSAKEVSKVCHFLIVRRVVTEDKEGLKKEAVITRSTMEIKRSKVVVHFKAIIFTLTIDVELVRSTISKIINISHGNTFREF